MQNNQTPAEALSQVLQWACSPRGGNNFWGRILNGCGRRAAPGIGTAAISLTREGKFMFLWDPEFFINIPMPLRIMVVIHEAAHIVLSHIERSLHMKQICSTNKFQWNQLFPLINTAQDFAANDTALRALVELGNFREFKKSLMFPENEEYRFPQGKSFEEYLAMLIEKCKKEGYDPNKQETDNEGNAIVEVYGVPMPMPGNGDQGDDDGQGQPQDGEGEGDGQKQGQGQGQGQPGKHPVNEAPQWLKDLRKNLMPQHIDWQAMADNMTDAEIERIKERAKRESKKIVKKAAQQTVKSRGTIPGSMQAVIDELLAEPSIPWHEVFKNLLRSSVSSKLSESTAWPHMGLLATGEAQGIEPYPGMQKDFEFYVTVAIDTSGSVSDEDFIKFMSEIQGLMKINKSVTTRVLLFDAAIQREFLIEPDDEVSYHCTRHGYGGTDFRPPFKRMLKIDTDEDWESNAEKIERHLPNSDLFVFFTDGYAPISSNDGGGPMPELTPPCPFVWVLTEDGREDPDMGGIVLQIDSDD